MWNLFLAVVSQQFHVITLQFVDKFYIFDAFGHQFKYISTYTLTVGIRNCLGLTSLGNAKKHKFKPDMNLNQM